MKSLCKSLFGLAQFLFDPAALAPFFRFARLTLNRRYKASQLVLAKKSCAPAFSEATAVSSPTVPEMMINGRSTFISCKSFNAAGALNVGIE